MSAPANAAEVSDNKPRIQFLGFVACISVLLVFYYSPVLFGGADYFMSDISYFFQPFCHFMAQCLKAGRTPFWNPYMYCGMSQVAIPSPGIFYPPTWLMIWLPFSVGLATYLMLHQMLAGIGAWLLVWRLGKGAVAAAVAGAICTLSGYMFSLSANFTLMATAAWLPLCVFLVTGIDGKYSFRNIVTVALAGLCCGLLVGPGRPEVAVPCLLLLALCAAWPLVDAVKAKKLDRAVALSAVLRMVPLACAVGLSAPVTIPALEWAKVSPRSQGLELKWVFTWSANWYDFVSLVLNHPVGDLMLLPNQFRNMVVSRLYYLPFLGSDYVGPAAVTLACFGMCDSRWKHRWLLLAIFFGFCLMAAGNYTPFAPTLLKLSSALATLRYPVKLLIFPIFLVGLSAAVGVHLIAQRRLPRTALLTACAIWFVALVSGLIMVASPGLSDIVVPSEYPRLMRESQSLFGWSLIQSSMLALMLCGAVAAFDFEKIDFKTAAFFIVVLVTVPMFSGSLQFDRHWAPPAEVVTNGAKTRTRFLEFKSPLAEKLRPLLADGRRFLTLYFDPLVVPPWYRPAPNWANDEKFYLYARELLLQDSHVAEAMPHTNGYEGAETVIYKDLFKEAYAPCSQNSKSSHVVSDAPIARLCQFAATGIVVTQAFNRPKKEGEPGPNNKEMDRKYFEKISEDRASNTRIYRVKNAHPRVVLVDALKVFPEVDECRNALLNKGWGARGAAGPYVALMTESDAAFVSEKLRARLLGSWSADGAMLTSRSDAAGDLPPVVGDSAESLTSRPALRKRYARLDSDKIDALEISTNSDSEELLLLADQYYPGWKARIDGAEVPIMRANVFARAVVVPPGKHAVIFTYEPDSVRLGICCAIATLGSLVLLFIPLIFLRAKSTPLRD